MRICDLRVGDALEWQLDSEYKNNSGTRYGVVLKISKDKKKAIIADVFENDNRLKCYDEKDALPTRDRDNVRLKHAPPPFRRISGTIPADKPFGVHDPKHPTIIDDAFLDSKRVKYEDLWCNRLDQRDIAELLNHPWPAQKELEATRKTLQPVPDTTHTVKSADYGISQAAPVKSKKLPPISPKTAQAETAPAAPKTPSKTLKQRFSDVEKAVEAQAGKSQPGQAKPKSCESDRPIGRLANLAENFGIAEDDGPDFGP